MGQDMRTWIDRLDRAGLLARISKPVDPRTQMGALLWQARDRALLFENLPDYPGWRCLGQAPGDVSLAPIAFDWCAATHPYEHSLAKKAKTMPCANRTGRCSWITD